MNENKYIKNMPQAALQRKCIVIMYQSNALFPSAGNMEIIRTKDGSTSAVRLAEN